MQLPFLGSTVNDGLEKISKEAICTPYRLKLSLRLMHYATKTHERVEV